MTFQTSDIVSAASGLRVCFPACFYFRARACVFTLACLHAYACAEPFGAHAECMNRISTVLSKFRCFLSCVYPLRVLAYLYVHLRAYV